LALELLHINLDDPINQALGEVPDRLNSIAADCQQHSGVGRYPLESDDDYVRRVITTLGAEADNHGHMLPEPDYYIE